MTDKPIKDLTPEERTAFIQEMKQSLTPEEWDNITTFAAMMNKAGDWWNSDDVKDTRADIGNAIQTAAMLIRGLSQFLPVFLEEIEKDAEACAMTMTDFIESGKCDELVDRATAKLEPGPDQYSLFPDEDKPHSPTDKKAAAQKARDAAQIARSKAIEKGALMSIGNRLSSFSEDDMKNSLNAFCIMRLPETVDKTVAFDNDGKLNRLALGKANLENLDSIHTAFLMAVVRLVEVSPDDAGNRISFYVTNMCRELNIDPRSYSTKRGKGDNSLDDPSLQDLRVNAILERIMPFDPLVGRTPDGSYYRVLSFESYEKDSDTLTVSAPYIFKLREIVKEREGKLKHSQFNRLLYSNVVAEPNRAAVELANRILWGLENRGSRADYKTYSTEPTKKKQIVTKTDDKGNRTTTTTIFDEQPTEQQNQPDSAIVTYRVKFSSLIADCPQLYSELQKIENHPDTVLDVDGHPVKDEKTGKNKKYNRSQAYNSKLKQVFEAAYRIILEKSDAPTAYRRFTLPTTRRMQGDKKVSAFDVPTKSTLGRYMIITHEGKVRGNL